MVVKCKTVFPLILISVLINRTWSDNILLRNDLEKLIIDTDGGADDIIAIAEIILANRKYMNNQIKILGVTCVTGNTELSHVATNVLKLFTLLNETSIPVYPGASKPILKKHNVDYHYGFDGIGDCTFDYKIESHLENKSAITALTEFAQLYPKQITILTLGPLTNIALASLVDTDFRNNIKNLIVLGGLSRGHSYGIPGKEFNFFSDPHALYIVFKDTEKPDLEPIVMVPVDMTHTERLTMEWRRNVFGKIPTELIKFFNKIETVSWTRRKRDHWLVHDSYAASVMLTHGVVVKSERHSVEPIHCGRADGSLLIDYGDSSVNYMNTVLITEFNGSIYRQLIIDIFTD